MIEFFQGTQKKERIINFYESKWLMVLKELNEQCKNPEESTNLRKLYTVIDEFNRHYGFSDSLLVCKSGIQTK